MLYSSIFALTALALPMASASPVGARGSAAPYTSPSSDWALMGCVEDQYPTDRVMSGAYMESSSLTPSSCLNFCLTKNFHLAGLENGNQCFCSQELYNGATVGPHGANLTTKNNDGCNIPASGRSSKNGGGANHLLVFESTVYPAPTIAVVPGAEYFGCYPDDVNNRVLPVWGNVKGGLTNRKCVAACHAQGYDIAGTEFGTQCWCGSSDAPLPNPDADGCNMGCEGGETKLCGGASFLNVYAYVEPPTANANLSTSSAVSLTAFPTSSATATATLTL